MKLLAIVLTLFLWAETPSASVIRQDEPFLELEIVSEELPLRPRNQDGEEGAKKGSSSKTVPLPKVGKPLSKAEFDNAIIINATNFNKTRFNGTGGRKDPILIAGMFEGDIAGVNISDIKSLDRNAIGDFNSRWSAGIIPYAIADTYDDNARLVIAGAMQEYHTTTCIKFVPRTNENDYVFIFQGIGCYSQVGRVGGAQLLSLAVPCLHPGVIVHELMHAIGFWHEQSRADRDSYVDIVWNNIQQGQEYNFQMYNWGYIQALNEAYDLNSIMHYGPYAFAQDTSQPTIIPKLEGSIMGQQQGFTEVDIRKVNTLYQCQTARVAAAVVSDCPEGDEECAGNATTTSRE